MAKNISFTLSIAHINDTHSHFEPTPISLAIPGIDARIFADVGGFSRIAFMARQFKQKSQLKSDGFLFLHAGDCFQGTLYFSLFKGEANATLLNMLHLDAMTLGNHELDLGNALVSRFLDQIQFPLLAGNWDVSQESETKPFPVKGKKRLYAYDPKNQVAHVLIKTFGDKKVAVFGVTLEKMADIAMPDLDTPFLNAKQTILNTVEYIKKVHATSYIVLLSHLGLEQDLKMAGSIEGISVIVGGHSHVLQGDFSNVGLGDMGPYGRCINGTLVVQAGCHSFAFGELEVTLSEDGHVTQYKGKNTLLLGQRFAFDPLLETPLCEKSAKNVRHYLKKQKNVLFCQEDKEIKALIDVRYKDKVDALKSDIVTYLPSKLRHTRVPDKIGGSEIAPLVCEGMLFAAKARGEHVDFAIHNAGGVRVSLNEGPLTVAEISGRLLPFMIDLMLYKPTGEQVHHAIEGAIDNAINNGVEGVGDGSFPYTAGLQYTYESHQPKGKRISKLRYLDQGGQWQPLAPDVRYVAVSSVYTSQGKEGYGALKQLSQIPESLGVTLPESFIEYARTLPQLEALKKPLINFLP